MTSDTPSPEENPTHSFTPLIPPESAATPSDVPTTRIPPGSATPLIDSEALTRTNLEGQRAAEGTLTLDVPVAITERVLRDPEAPPGFAIERRLGKGAMGEVFLAHQHGLNRYVALKIVIAESNSAVVRFLAEADAAAAVRHPNVVPVYAYGEHNRRPYLVMEYCAGGTLADRVKKGQRMTPHEAAQLMVKIADGVAAAHALGIVHRDLKPGNILLDEAGEPKVTDFGLAKRGTGSDLTHTGAVIGTPAFMSPEQAKGEVKFVGPESDVWALGVILYLLLTGEQPFVAPDMWGLMSKIQETEPSAITSRAPTVPRDLVLVTERCLRKSSADRYPTAKQLAEDLQRFLAGDPVLARPVPRWERAWKWARRNPFRAAAIATSGGLVAAIVVAALTFAENARLDARAARSDAEVNRLALADSERITAVLVQASGLFAQAERQAAQAPRDRQDPRYLDDWNTIARDASTVNQLLRQEPSLSDGSLRRQSEALVAEASRMLKANQEWKEGRLALNQLASDHAEVIFAGADIAGMDDLVQVDTRIRKVITDGLARFGISRPGDSLRLDPTLYTEAERDLISERCYEIVLLDARRHWIRSQVGSDAEKRTHRAEAQQRLTMAAALRPEGKLTQAGRDLLLKIEPNVKLSGPVPPLIATDHYIAALEHYEGNASDETIEALTRVLRLRANHIGAVYLLAMKRMKAKQYRAAFDELTTLRDQYPTIPWPRLLRAQTAMELDLGSEAEIDMNYLLSQPISDGVKYVVWNNLGLVAIQKRDWIKAKSVLETATALRPAAFQAYVNLAVVARRQSEVPLGSLAVAGTVAIHGPHTRAGWNRALIVLDQAIERCPKTHQLFHERAQLWLLLRDRAKARLDLETGITYAREGQRDLLRDDLISLGKLHAEDGRHEQAVNAFKLALQSDPSAIVASRMMAEPLVRLGRYDEAAKELDRYLATIPVTTERGARAAAEVLRDQGRLFTEDLRASQLRGVLHTQKDNLRGAIESYTRGLALVRDPETLTLRGWAYLTIDSPRLAVSDFDEAIQLTPTSIDALLGRATARVQTGYNDIRVIEADIDRVLASQPIDRLTLYRAARVSAMLGTLLVRTRTDLEPGFRHIRRSVTLLEQVLTATPEAERSRFWREYVLADRAFDGLRAGPLLEGLSAKYGRSTP